MNANQNQNGLPPWMQAEKISISERLEITSCKVITYIPVAVTMGHFTFSFAYYSFVSQKLSRIGEEAPTANSLDKIHFLTTIFSVF